MGGFDISNEPDDDDRELTNVESWVAGRIALDLLVDLTNIGRCGGDLLDLVLVVAVLHANTAPLQNDPELSARYATLSALTPDAFRRPVSINAVATSLGQPFETTRRRINRLVGKGICAVTAAGVYVAPAAFQSPDALDLARGAYGRFVEARAAAQDAGVIGGSRFDPPSPEDVGAPLAVVCRLLAAYWLRFLETLRPLMLDPLTSFIFIGVMQASWREMSPASAGAKLRAGRWIGDEGTPIRLAELSRRLGLPHETARRRLNWLVDRGYCVRSPHGVMFESAALRTPQMRLSGAANLTSLRRMFALAERAFGAPGPAQANVTG